MTSMEENKVKIFSYAKVWKVEKKIYSISNIPLPVPINPYDLLAFLGVALVVMIISNIIPGIGKVPVVIRYVAIPYCSVHYLMKKKLDGKNPIKYFVGCIVYFINIKRGFVQRFRKYPDKTKDVSLNWNCSRGIRKEET